MQFSITIKEKRKYKARNSPGKILKALMESPVQYVQGLVVKRCRGYYTVKHNHVRIGSIPLYIPAPKETSRDREETLHIFDQLMTLGIAPIAVGRFSDDTLLVAVRI